MNLKVFALIGSLFVPFMAHAALPHVGMYQTIDDKTNAPKSIVALYEYDADGKSMLAGRVVALYDADGQISETLENPTKVADKVSGAPKYVGMDIIWNMEWDDKDNSYQDGNIMDPQSGKVYSSVIWQDMPETLNVRGKIGPFGRTQTWRVMDAAVLPGALQNVNTDDWTPLIRK